MDGGVMDTQGHNAPQATTAALLILVALMVFAAGWTWVRRPLNLRDVQNVQVAAPAVLYRVDVNRAGVPELCLLPGIGPGFAERIRAERDARGGFHDAADLQRVKGIGARTAERLGPWVIFGGTTRSSRMTPVAMQLSRATDEDTQDIAGE